jgi:glycosyltransferase involved in cell wall biosynthesis
VREYCRKIKNITTINVSRQGVGFARIAAIEKAIGKYIVFFDYDNEPESDYLQELKKLNEKYPEAGAWGPGNITVDFIDGIDPLIENYGRIAFQEKHEPDITYANIREWQACYPFGTGLCTKVFLLKEYVDFVNQGRYTMPGRKGAQLSGGEDTQMVLHCVSKGYAAGISPLLKLKHIIPAVRANINYLKRFAYSTSLDYQSCLLQVFPEHKERINRLKISESKFSRQALKKFLKSNWSSNVHKLFDLCRFIGFNVGIYRALEKPIPKTVRKIIKYLGIE